ncbi:MAG: lysophospholipid acyltransferase family protein [Kiritimatiellae bacterium]|nr:lysophospholipid acyltransferase family protein [Kiritimatiellia bacterium]MDW8458615.1 GNAT family N-acyltransferase [Verrucomicrobiota bacterium]
MSGSEQIRKLINLGDYFKNPLQQKVFSVIGGAVERALAIDRINQLYYTVATLDDDRHFLDRVLDVMNIETKVSESDLDKIPRSGPLVVVANHPFGGIEGIILGALLRSVRPDVKLMANFLLKAIPDLHDSMIFVDPFDRKESAQINMKPLKESIRWLKSGGVLGVFPAGEVSHIDLRRGGICDPEWSPTIARLIRLTESPALPVFFRGSNSLVFQILGLVHPRLRTGMLPRELINKSNKSIEVRIGTLIPWKRLAPLTDDRELMDYLRMRTYHLRRRREEKKPIFRRAIFPIRMFKPEKMEIAPPVAPELLKAEIEHLPDANRLVESGDFAVYYAEAARLPNILREIGRLRELTFRGVGEGTGQALDLDRFDDYYLHVFVWNRSRSEIVGAYRLGKTDEIVSRLGIRGLYTSTLFRYRRRLLERLGPALEMGRSFVRPEYQKNFSPLMLLWKGIALFIADHPKYKILFGPVSINNDYQSISRQLLISFLKINNFEPDLAKLVRARKPPLTNPFHAWQLRRHQAVVNDLEEIDSLIADLETDLKGMPILLRQYLRLGGRLLGFNIDPSFGNCLDGLILVDLTETDRSLLVKYMGREKAERFLAFHGIRLQIPDAAPAPPAPPSANHARTAGQLPA